MKKKYECCQHYLSTLQNKIVAEGKSSIAYPPKQHRRIISAGANNQWSPKKFFGLIPFLPPVKFPKRWAKCCKIILRYAKIEKSSFCAKQFFGFCSLSHLKKCHILLKRVQEVGKNSIACKKKIHEIRPSILCVTHQMNHTKRNYSAVPYMMMNYK